MCVPRVFAIIVRFLSLKVKGVRIGSWRKQNHKGRETAKNTKRQVTENEQCTHKSSINIESFDNNQFSEQYQKLKENVINAQGIWRNSKRPYGET